MEKLRIAVAADNAGVALKDVVAEQLRDDDRVAEVTDFGVGDESDDRAYPLLGLAAARAVADGRADRAVLVCGTGIGMAISANKVEGVRATVAHDSYSAERSILSNDCQVLCLGGRVIGPELAKKLVDEWVGHEFDPDSASATKVAHITEFERAQQHEPQRSCGAERATQQHEAQRSCGAERPTQQHAAQRSGGAERDSQHPA